MRVSSGSLAVVLPSLITLSLVTALFSWNGIQLPAHKFSLQSATSAEPFFPSGPVTSCAHDYRIFVYPLPFVFNYATIPYIISTSWLAAGKSSMFVNTNMMVYANEIAMDFALQQHPCRTYDPEEATFFYLPVYLFFAHIVSQAAGQSQPQFQQAIDLLDKALLQVDKFSQSSAARWQFWQSDDLQQQEMQTAVDAFFAFADEWMVRDLKQLQRAADCQPTLEHGQQIIADYRCVLVGHLTAEHAAQPNAQYPLLHPLPSKYISPRTRLPLSEHISRNNRTIPASLLPSTYKHYFTRQHLCDHLLVTSRGNTGWEARYWTFFEPSNAILLTNQISWREDYRRLAGIRKNLAIGQISELQSAYKVVAAQLLHRLRQHSSQLQHQQSIDAVTCAMDTNTQLKVEAEQFAEQFGSYLSGTGEAGGPARQASGIPTHTDVLHRPTFSYFYGSVGNYTTRQNLRSFLRQYDADNSVAHEMSGAREIDPIIFSYAYLQSTFCWIPPGDAYFTNRLYDVMAAGCIPLIINNGWYIPYPSLQWDTFSIRFFEADIKEQPGKVMAYLRSLTEQDILTMQVNLYAASRYLMYSLHEYDYRSQIADAVDVMLHELQFRSDYATTCEYKHNFNDVSERHL